MKKLNIVMDSCTAILLAKASVLESAARTFRISLPRSVYDEVLAGKEKNFTDAFLTERLVETKLLSVTEVRNVALGEGVRKHFAMGEGESDTIALAVEGDFDLIATDNKQGRKAAQINSLNLVGSPELIISLLGLKKMSKDKARQALKILKNEGWFNVLLIERLLEEVDKNV